MEILVKSESEDYVRSISCGVDIGICGANVCGVDIGVCAANGCGGNVGSCGINGCGINN